MGYRSDVMALIYPDTDNDTDKQARYDQLKLLMATTFSEVAQHFSAEMHWLDQECVLKFDIQDSKWYPGYSDVQMFESMRRQFDEDIEGYYIEFVRVGEKTSKLAVMATTAITTLAWTARLPVNFKEQP
jgi:hypothetical protein